MLLSRGHPAVLVFISAVAVACSDVTSPSRSLLVPAPVRDVQALPVKTAILSWVPGSSQPLDTYDFVEGVLVEGWIHGFTHVTSDSNALAVHVDNKDVDYKGVWESGLSQCDWAGTIHSPQLDAPGLQACLSTYPYYTQQEDWRDTLVLGGIGGNGVITARRGGGTLDGEFCTPPPNPKKCHTITGSQTIKLTPLVAAINLTTPNVTQIAPKTILLPDPNNGSTTFTVSSTPASYHGITVPTQALSWQWIPSQGDSTVGAACPVLPTTSLSKTCSSTLYETGMMVVSARVNGVPQTDTIHVVGPQMTMTVEKTSMWPSHTVKGVTTTQSVHVSVIDTAGNKIPNKTVRFWLSAIEGGGGHDHVSGSTPKPAGTIPIIVTTDGNGDAVVTYTSPEAGGPIYIKATLSGAGSVQKQVMVEVPGLEKYQETPDYKVTGAITGMHTRNHYARPTHKQMLQMLASEYHKSFPNSEVLWFNDSSLPSGGVFDVALASSKRWLPPHAWHRYGQDTDLRTNDSRKDGNPEVFTRAQKERIKIIWLHVLPKATPFQRLLDHILLQDAPPHFHLIYCDGSVSTTLCF